MKWGLKGGISIDADFGPHQYVLWCCGSICRQLFTFIQIGYFHTVVCQYLPLHLNSLRTKYITRMFYNISVCFSRFLKVTNYHSSFQIWNPKQQIKDSLFFCILSSKMSLERLVQSSSIKIEEIILPEEVWIKIWSYLDFKTVQKICTCVTKSWLKMIRSSKLSWEMKVEHHEFHNVDVLEVETFNGILSHWENLRAIHFSFEREFVRFCLSLNSHQSLEKIVILSGPIL